ncbi:MAG: nucleotidyl transferase AbiEii/AbiGii toxin family protein [Chloroflexi bacterium]|nr:nucleotidyl transferase AbiEii/AbiGii toxin family protein [Chloroflexota bacterium]
MRYHVTSYLAGRRFEELTLDVGFGDPLTGKPERLRGPDLLGFAEIEATEIPVLPLESHVAEKVHAYTRSYARGRPSTRVKDLSDLVLIPSLFAFAAGRLRSALDATFAARATHPVPTAPPPPAAWRAGYRRLAAEIGLDPEMSVGYAQARAFLDPVLARSVAEDAI